MTIQQFKKIAWDENLCDTLSFRGLLSKKYYLKNKNFSMGGSSNQKQFRLAKEFFNSHAFKTVQKEYEKIIVLWGITSTARNEMFFVETNQLENFFYSEKIPLVKSLLKYNYSHQNEVNLLCTEMEHWNTYFENLNVKNLWFDTFNHHDYWQSLRINYQECAGPNWPSWNQFIENNFKGVSNQILEQMKDQWSYWPRNFVSLPNLIFRNLNPRDIMSQLTLENHCKDIDNKFHASTWDIDSNRVKYLVDCDILNPFSFHPTKHGHQQIANMLSKSLESIL